MVAELRQWAVNHNLDKWVLEGFWKNFHNYKIEYPEESEEVFGNTTSEDLILNIRSVSLNLGNWPECNYNTISAIITIFVKCTPGEECKELGYYKIFYTLDGKVENDIFEIY